MYTSCLAVWRVTLKRKLRGTLLHRLYRRVADQLAGGRSSSLLSRLNAAYDRQTVEVMRCVLRHDSSCIDMGAHKGDILQHMVAIAPVGTHHAFEALPHLAADLQDRFPGVRVHQIAVSDNKGEADFQYVENDPGYSGLRRRIYDRPDPRILTIRVLVATVDEVIPADQPIAFMKIDIEGGEYHAIKGAVRTIRRWQPVIVFEAGSKSTGQYGVTAADLYGLITKTLGYELSTMGRWLGRESAMTRQEFDHNWENGPDFYFIATPAGVRAEPGAAPTRSADKGFWDFGTR
jgi:FkbM family methyltransferase